MRLTISDLQQLLDTVHPLYSNGFERRTVLVKSPAPTGIIAAKLERILEDLSVLSPETEVIIRPVLGNVLD